MLKIQVLGKGIIPRGYGLAPRKEFFNADLTLIHTIMLTPGLKVNMLCPDDNKIIPLTNNNLKRLWDKYRSDKVVAPKVAATVKQTAPVEQPKTVAPTEVKPTVAPVTPVVEQPKVEEVKVEVKEEVKVEETVAPVVEEVKEVATETKEEVKEENTSNNGIKPVNNPNNNNNNKGNNNNHKK